MFRCLGQQDCGLLTVSDIQSCAVTLSNEAGRSFCVGGHGGQAALTCLYSDLQLEATLKLWLQG